MRAARGLPARGGVQDRPPAPPLPAAAPGAEIDGVLAGGRRGRAGAPARLHAPGPGVAPGLRSRRGVRHGAGRMGRFGVWLTSGWSSLTTIPAGVIVLRTAGAAYDLSFGIYAKVIQAGTVHLGDELRLMA